MRAVVVLPMPGQLDETNIGVDGGNDTNKPRCNEVDGDSSGVQLQGR